MPEFPHRVEVQYLAQLDQFDSTGQQVQEWTTYRRCWAKITPLAGREAVQAKQLVGEVSHKITLRWFDGLLATNRIKWGTRSFELEQPVNVGEANRTWEVMATEQPPLRDLTHEAEVSMRARSTLGANGTISTD